MAGNEMVSFNLVSIQDQQVALPGPSSGTIMVHPHHKQSVVKGLALPFNAKRRSSVSNIVDVNNTIYYYYSTT